jgi:UDP-N-acetyl-D-glucosamine dehydrogenase
MATGEPRANPDFRFSNPHELKRQPSPITGAWVGSGSPPSRGRVRRSAGAATPGEGGSAIRRIGEMKIAVVGLGYVGLPLALLFARKGCEVTGIDIDPAKIDKLRKGKRYIRHIVQDDLPGLIRSGRFTPTADFKAVRRVDAVIIAVPTPLTKNREPDVSYIVSTGKAIGPHLRKGMLVVLESTTYPGSTDEDLLPVLEELSGLKAGRDFHLAFSPEREDPGNPNSIVSKIPKVVGGLTPACRAAAVRLYSLAVEKVVPVRDNRTAEAVKLLENVFRGVNIALVNELKVVFDAMGLDVWDIIEAAKTKPFGFMPFYPGPGLGGHCIPLDPFYLTWKAREFGQHTRFIELSGEINTAMPEYVVNKACDALNGRGKALQGARVLLLGLAYKKNVDDDRESPAYHIIELLERRGAKVSYHDPFIPVIRPSREHGHLAGRKSQPLTAANLKKSDCVVIITDHANVDYELIGQHARLVVDSRNAMAHVKRPRARIVKS